MENYYKNAMIAAEFRKSKEGKRLGGYIELQNKIANELLNFYEEEICCSLNTIDTLNSNALPIKMNLLLQLIILGIKIGRASCRERVCQYV